MDFDTAKENIQPLRGGRNVEKLGMALADHKELLETEKKSFEEQIKEYQGYDPLAPWYEYILWIEQSYPKHGNDSPLDQILLKCILQFEADPRYRQDRRLIKLYIKFIDSHENPHEMYLELWKQGIGTMVADMYIAWAYYYDILDNFKQAESVFRKGLDCGAQPFDELAQAHHLFKSSIAQRVLFDEESKQNFMSNMEEKRSALTSLKAHKQKFVGSQRTGEVVKSYLPGVVNQENISVKGNQASIQVHQDVCQDPVTSAPANQSVIRSLIDSARKRENEKEIGPWSKATTSHAGSVFGKHLPKVNFNIAEDSETYIPIPYTVKNFHMGIQLPKGFVSKNDSQTEWEIPMVIEEPEITNSLPMYNKFLLYPKNTQKGMEFTHEELRGYNWFKQRGIVNALTVRCDSVWINNYENGIRLPPGFVNSNIKQDEMKMEEVDLKTESNEYFMMPLKFVYPKGGNDLEMSLEERLKSKWQRGEIKVSLEVSSNFDEDMEETFVGQRRQSIHPLAMLPRKSIMPQNSILPLKQASFVVPKVIEELPVKEGKIRFDLNPSGTLDFQEPKASGSKIPGVARKSIIKRKIEEFPELSLSSKNHCAIETPPRENFVAPFHFEAPKEPTGNFDCFVKPQVPRKSNKLFEGLDDEEEAVGGPFFGLNETACTTQQFNLFLPAQSVSTPISKKPQKFFMTEPHSNSPLTTAQADDFDGNSPSEGQQTMPQPKQLSVIMETTETTSSTKSTVEVNSPENLESQDTSQHANHDGDLISPDLIVQENQDNQTEIPQLPSFQVYDDQTTQNIPILQLIKPQPIGTPNVKQMGYQQAHLSQLRSPEDPDSSMNSFQIGDDLTSQLMKMQLPKIHEIHVPEIQKARDSVSFMRSPSSNSKSLVTDIEGCKHVTKPIELKEISPKMPAFNIYDINTTDKLPIKKNGNLADSMMASFMMDDDLTQQKMLLIKTQQRTAQASMAQAFDIYEDTTQHLQLKPELPEKSMMASFLMNDDLTEQKMLINKNEARNIPTIMVTKERSFSDCIAPSADENNSEAAEVGKIGEMSRESLTLTEENSSLSRNKSESKQTKLDFEIFQDEDNDRTLQTANKNVLPPVVPFKIFMDESATSVVKPTSVPFEIFEDDTGVIPSTLFKKESYDPLSISKKENFVPKTSNFHRQFSDEFYNMLDTPGKPVDKKNQIFSEFGQRKIQDSFDDDMSDPMFKIENAMHISNFEQTPGGFANFSYVGKVEQDSRVKEPSIQIESSMHELCIDEPTISGPIPYDEENLNTEKFNLNMHGINSTLLVQPANPSQLFGVEEYEEKEVNLSISMDEDELSCLNDNKMKNASKVAKKVHEEVKDVFKMPGLPVPIKKAVVPSAKFDIYEDKQMEEEADLSKSIYYEDHPRSVAPGESSEEWEELESDYDHSLVLSHDNQYEHTVMEHSEDRSLDMQVFLAENKNPFSRKVQDSILDQCGFSGYLAHEIKSCLLVKKLGPLRKGDEIKCGEKDFLVQKLIGKGSFGQIYSAKCLESGEIFALKQERPANLWEYYICLELKIRLQNTDILPGFMDVEQALIGNYSSILASKFAPYGSLIEVCNKIKKVTNKNVDEYVAMVLTSQLLSIIDHLHGCKIIHADIKPDNFVLMRKLGYDSRVPAVQLIDFGVAIDMEWFDENTTFTTINKTENFTCIEMKEKKPWTYQTDLYGLAGTAHVILFGKYMEVSSKMLKWNITTRMPRYLNKDIWNSFFSTLLNIPNCKSMPNLQNLKTMIQEELVEREKFVKNKILEFNAALN